MQRNPGAAALLDIFHYPLYRKLFAFFLTLCLLPSVLSDGSLSNRTVAADFRGCLQGQNGTWRAVQGELYSGHIASLAECASFCAQAQAIAAGDTIIAGLHDSDICICASERSTCGACPASIEEQCDLEYVSDAVDIESALSVSNISLASSLYSVTFEISSNRDDSILTVDFGDGSDPLTGLSLGQVSHVFLLPGSYHVAVTSQLLTSGFSIDVAVHDVPVVEPPAESLTQILGSEVATRSVRLLRGNYVQVKWTRRDGGGREAAPSPCMNASHVYLAGAERCYAVVDDSVTWQAAQEHCEQQGGHVATPRGQAEVLALLNALQDSSRVWLGLRDSNLEGAWFWPDGHQLTSNDALWAENEPNEVLAWVAESSSNSGVDIATQDCAVMEVTEDGRSAVWRDEDCETSAHYVCQYPAWDVYSVSKSLVGVPLTVHNDVTILNRETETWIGNSWTSTYIFPDLEVWTAGTLDALLFEVAAPLDTNLPIKLQLYRPSCSASNFLVPAGFNGAPVTHCSSTMVQDTATEPDDQCPVGQSYCPFTASCLSPNSPCTCTHESVNCHTVSTEDLRQFTPPIYTLVASLDAVLRSGSEGVLKMSLTSSEISVEEYDVLGIQTLASYTLPIRCEDVSNSNSSYMFHRQMSHQQSGWLQEGATVTLLTNSTSFSKCNMAALVTQPIDIHIPNALTRDTDFDSSVYSFEYEIISPVLAERFGQVRDGLVMLEPCRIDLSGEPCLLPARELVPVWVAVESSWLQYDTVTLRDTQSSTISSATFSRDCPAVFANSSSCEAANSFTYQAVLNATLDVGDTTLEFSACTRNEQCIELSINATIRRRVRIYGIDTNPENFYANDHVVLSINHEGTDPVFEWNISNSIIPETSSSINRTFPEPNAYEVSVRGSNIMGPYLYSETIYALDDFNASSLATNFPVVVASGRNERVAGSAQFDPFNRGKFTFSFEEEPLSQDGFELNTEPNTRNVRGSVLHVFHRLGVQMVNVTLLDPLTGDFFDFVTGSLEVWHPIDQVILETNNSVVETGESMLFRLEQVNGTGNFTYSVDFGDEDIDNFESNETTEHSVELTQNFSGPGIYNVTATVSNIVTENSSTFRISVQDRISGLELDYNGPTFVNETVTIGISLTTGTDVEYEINDGRGSESIIQSERNVEIEIYEVGNYTVTVTARNGINSETAGVAIAVIDLGEFQFHGILHDPCLATSVEAHFTANVSYHSLEWLSFSWAFSDGTVFSGNGLVTVNHAFTQPGDSWVRLEVDSVRAGAVERREVSSNVCVQTAIQGVTVGPTDVILAMPDSLSPVAETLWINLQHGSNLVIDWYYFGENHMTNASEETIWFSEPGSYNISVDICNAVSRFEQVISVLVCEELGDIRVYENQRNLSQGGYLPTGQNYTLDISVTQGTHIEWLVSIGEDGSVVELQENGANFSYTNTDRSTELRTQTISIHVRNPVDDRQQNITVQFQEAITELVLDASEISVYENEEIQFTSSIATGSPVSYSWMIYPGGAQVELNQETTGDSQITWSVGEDGFYEVKITAENGVSSMMAAVNITVWQHYGIFITSPVASFPYVPVGELVTFRVETRDFVSPVYQWNLIDADMSTVIEESDAVLEHNFTSDGIFEVGVVITEDTTRSEANRTIFAQYPVTDLNLTLINGDTYLRDTPVHMTYGVSFGTNVSYEWSIWRQLGNGGYMQDSSRHENPDDIVVFDNNNAVVIFTRPQNFRVDLRASNEVSERTVSVYVTVIAPVEVTIVDCCEMWHSDEPITLTASHSPEEDVLCVWSVDGDELGMGSSVEHTFTEPGQYAVSVTCHNLLSEDTASDTVTVIELITSVNLTRDIDELFYYGTDGMNITFTAHVVGGDSSVGVGSTPLTNTWYLNGSLLSGQTGSSIMLELGEGWYFVRVVVTDVLQLEVSDFMIIQVQELRCEHPQQTIIGSPQRSHLRSSSFKIEVFVIGCPGYGTDHQWVAINHTSGEDVNFPLGMSHNTPTLTFAQRSMDYGIYRLQLTSTFQRTPASSTIEVLLTIRASQLKAIIDGGSGRTLANDVDITIDGSPSYDPDLSTVQQGGPGYAWHCASSANNRWEERQDSDEVTSSVMDRGRNDHCDWISQQTSASIEVAAGLVLSDHQYNITLVVSSPNRTSGAFTQIIYVRDSTVPIVSINCISCRESNIFTISRSQHIKLTGSCTHCPLAQYDWVVVQLSDGSLVHLEDNDTSTGTQSPNLVIKKNVLADDHAYSFTLSVTSLTAHGQESTGMASITLEPASPPSNGSCVIVSNSSIVALQDTFTVQCQGWETTSSFRSTLTYHIYVRTGSDWYPIYSGTSPVVSSYLSMEGEANVVHLYVEVIDESHASITALAQRLHVVDPTPDANQTVTQWIALHASQEMSYLRDQNDPKILLQYMIAVNLQLNAESSLHGGNALDAADQIRRENLRREMLHVLNMTTVISAMDDIQQVAYVLRLLTTQLNEFPVSLDMFEISLHLMDTIVQVLSDEVSPAMTGEEFVPNYMVTAVSNLMEIMYSEVLSDASASQDPAVIHIQEMAVTLTNRVCLLALRTQVVEEQPVIYGTEYLKVTGQRVLGEDIQTSFDDGDNQLTFPEDLMMAHRNQEIFQVALSFKYNPHPWGFNISSRVTSRPIIAYFTHVNGSEISVSGLENRQRVRMCVGQEDISGVRAADGVRSRRSITTGYHQIGVTNTTTDVTVVELSPRMRLSSLLDIFGSRLPDGSSINVTVSLTGIAPQANESEPVEVHVYLGRGYVPHSDKYKQELLLTQADTAVSFFILENFTSDAGSQAYYLTLENTGRETVNTSVHLFATTCLYYAPDLNIWTNDGCEPEPNSAETESNCVCSHMTMFASAVLVSPADLDFKDLLSVNFNTAPVALILIIVLTVLYIGVAIIAARLDAVDAQRTSVVPLCGPTGPFQYEITVVTGRRAGAGTSAHVGIKLQGSCGKIGNRHLQKSGAFQRGSTDSFLIATTSSLGNLTGLTIWHDNAGLSPSWYLSRVVVRCLKTNATWYFVAQCWLSLEQEKGSIQKKLRPADEHEKASYRLKLGEEAVKGVSDRHLWISLLERPARCRFSRLQRATICITLLYCYMFLSALWYGLLHAPEDFESVSATVYLQWTDVLVGALACLITFPIAVAIIQLFKHIKPKADQVLPGQFGPEEEIELDVDYQGSSRVTSASTQVRGRGRDLYLIRLPSNLSQGSDLQSQTGALHRTRNTESRPAGSTSPPTAGKQAEPVSKKALTKLEPLWTHDNILKQWELAQGTNTPSSTSNAAFSAKRGGTDGGRGVGSASTRSSSFYTVDEDYFDYDYLDINSLYEEPQEKARFNPRQDPSLLNLSMGSLGTLPTLEDAKPPLATTASWVGPRSFAGRQRHQSQTSAFSGGETLEDVAEADSAEIAAEAESEFAVPIQRLDALEPGYQVAEGEPPVQHLPLPPRPNQPACELPHRCVYLAYTLCFVLCAISAVFILLYGYEFKQQGVATKWLFATFIAFINSFFILEPLKVIIVALVVAKVTDNIEGCEERLCTAPMVEGSECLKDIKMRPLAGYALLQAEQEGKKVVRMREMMRNFIAFMFFLLLVLLINYASCTNWLGIYAYRHTNSTYTVPRFSNTSLYTQTDTYARVLDYADYWAWLENVGAPGIHARQLQPQAEHDYVLGRAVLRQKRSLPVSQCQAESKLRNNYDAAYVVQNGCYGDPGWREDTYAYPPGWAEDSALNQSEAAWVYRTGDSMAYEGHVSSYGEGGFVQELGETYEETLNLIANLKSLNWLDRATRAILMEFTTYNMNTGLFSVVTLAVEFPVSSAAISSHNIQPFELINYTSQRITPYFIAEILLFAILIVLIVSIVLKLRRDRCAFFKSFDNWLKLALTSLTCTSVFMYIAVLVICTQAYNKYLDKRYTFTDFSHAVYWQKEWQIVNAVLLFILTLVVVYQLRFIRIFARFIKTIQKARWPLLGMAFFFLAFLVYYAQLGYLWFGTVTYAMRSVGSALPSTLSLFRGTVPFLDPMVAYDLPFTACFYVSFVTIMFVYILGGCMAILNSTYKQVRMELYYHATVETQDYEMVDFMMKRFKMHLKLTKPKPAFRKVQFQGLPSVSSRQSTAKSYRSLGPLSSASTASLDSGDLDPSIYNDHLIDRAEETWARMLRKLENVEQLDKQEASLEKQLKSHYTAHSAQKTVKPKSSAPRLPTVTHDRRASLLSRLSDASHARDKWQKQLPSRQSSRGSSDDASSLAMSISPAAPTSPFKSRPRDRLAATPAVEPRSPLDPEIIISKPPIGPAHSFQRRGDPMLPPYEPSFGSSPTASALSSASSTYASRRTGNRMAAVMPIVSEPVSTTVGSQQPFFSPRKGFDFHVLRARHPDTARSNASVSDVLISERDNNRNSAFKDLPWAFTTSSASNPSRGQEHSESQLGDNKRPTQRSMSLVEQPEVHESRQKRASRTDRSKSSQPSWHF